MKIEIERICKFSKTDPVSLERKKKKERERERERERDVVLGSGSLS
jgi:hypothetical protein